LEEKNEFHWVNKLFFFKFLSNVLVLRPSLNDTMLRNWLLNLKWTPESTREWQEFYNHASRLLVYGQSGNVSLENLPTLPQFKDLQPPECKHGIPSLAIRQKSFVFVTLISFLTTIIKTFL
jgi:hypothetical protein